VTWGGFGAKGATAYCVDADPHEPCKYEWLSKPPSAKPYVRIMRYGSTTLKSAVRDVDGLTYREIGEELGIPRPSNADYKGDYPTVRKAVQRGRKILERAFGKEGWPRQAEAMRADATRWKSLSSKEQFRESLAEELGVSPRDEDALVEAYAESFAPLFPGEPAPPSKEDKEEIRRMLF
jgi:hypothetical protein